MKKASVAAAVLLAGSNVVFADGSTYTVENTVRLEKPQNFGVNFESPGFTPWTSSRFQNFWNDAYSMEPIHFRHNSRATGGGADYLEDISGQPCAANPSDKSTSPGSAYWSVMRDGLWDGADITIYRETGDSLRVLRKDKVKRFAGAKDSEQKIYLEGSGEPIQKGDLYVLDMVRMDIPADQVRSNAPNLVKGPLSSGTPEKCYDTAAKAIPWIMDPGTFAPEGGSTASLKVSLPGKTAGGQDAWGVGQQYIRFGGRDIKFRPGKEYVCEVWLKQDGLKSPVLVQVGDRGSKEFSVGDEWKKYTLELDNTKPVAEGVPSLFIGSTSAGTLWIDNLLVSEKGVPPFSVYPDWEKELVDWKPGQLRSMNGRYLMSLDVQLTEGFARKLTWTPTDGLKTGGGIGLKTQLELCEKSGASPYLMTYILPSDEELDHLMEYLGAPADTGYGKLRAAHGHPKPWTEVFDKIYVECANEMWNSLFVPQAFPGDPELCGKLSNRIFGRLKSSPYNTRKNIMGMAPGWAHALYKNKDKNTGAYTGGGHWTFRCIRVCTNMDAVATAPSGYIGGWDGMTPVGQSDDELFKGNLFYSAQVFEPKLAEITAMRDEIRKTQGREFEMVKYEAGPGYSLPNPQKPFSEEEEKIGKSLALGIATLDNFLFVMANNGNANYFLFTRGNNWSSHSMNMDPHTTWLALALRNKYCKGELLNVSEGDLTRIDIPEVQSIGLNNKGQRNQNILPAVKGCPLTRVYAFRDGDRYSFIALNRSFTEPQQITLELPYEPQSGYTEILLAHENPRVTNRDALNADIKEVQKSGFSRKFTLTLPPASACVLVNEAKN